MRPLTTPLPLPSSSSQGKGPVIDNPIRTMEQVKQVTRLQAEESCGFVGESLRILRQEVRRRRGAARARFSGGSLLGAVMAIASGCIVCARAHAQSAS